jgi:hypothetical protein
VFHDVGARKRAEEELHAANAKLGAWVAELEKGEVLVRVEDNGVRLEARRWGPFWGAFIHAVRNAVDHGIEPTPADLRRALLPDGLSTADTVTEVSGRGLGMAALLGAPRALGGELGVDTRAGAGTTLRMTFPRAASPAPSA